MRPATTLAPLTLLALLAGLNPALCRGASPTTTALAPAPQGDTAMTAFRKNMEAAGFLPRIIRETWRDALIKGFYTDDDLVALSPRAAPVGLIVAASVDFVFNQGRWYTLAGPKRQARALTQEEFARFRATRLLPAIDLQRAIKIVYGKGSRKLIVFSAIDCPHCQIMEEELRQSANKLNATLYLFPATLRGNDPKAVAAVQALWCHRDNAGAWKDFWRTRTLPPAQPACGLGNRHSHLLLRAVKGTGFPNAVLEDGSVVFAGDGNWVRLLSQPAPSRPVWE